jgi:hypothetical protein
LQSNLFNDIVIFLRLCIRFSALLKTLHWKCCWLQRQG